MKRIVIDLDGTLTLDESGVGYSDKKPNPPVVEMVRHYKSKGFEIVISTARNMRTYGGSIGKITAKTLPVILEWLDRHQIPYDEILVGKPWCGSDGFYVDDKAIRPSEFCRLSYTEIVNILVQEGAGDHQPANEGEL